MKNRIPRKKKKTIKKRLFLWDRFIDGHINQSKNTIKEIEWWEKQLSKTKAP